MDLQEPSIEQFYALGGAVIATVAVAMLLFFLVMAGCLKLSISLIARHKISFLSALGYLFAMTVLNALIGSVLGSTLGPIGGLLSLPLSIFATLACISQAGNCGYLRAFGVYIVFCIISTVGIFMLALMLLVPLGMIGTLGEGLPDGFMQAENQESDLDTGLGGEIQEVNWDSITFADEPATGTSGESESDVNETATEVQTVTPPVPERQKAPAPKRAPRKPKRAPDGTQLNPFFQ
ncbi:MAG: hypothetical protein AAFV88_21705 [Planctomycetota bacterium]